MDVIVEKNCLSELFDDEWDAIIIAKKIKISFHAKNARMHYSVLNVSAFVFMQLAAILMDPQSVQF